MKLTVVIVNYNVRYYLEQCLTSVQQALNGLEGEVIVVDNHSRDGSVEALRSRFPSVVWVESMHNLGFARANNIAIRQSHGEYVLLLNPDTFVGEQVLAEAVRFMDKHPQAGGVGVQMLNTDGTRAMESRRGLPTPMTAFYKMCGLCSRYPRSHRFGRYYMSYLSWDEPARIDIISGAFCLLRRSALDQVGLLDETFFMYGEDIDLSYRLLKGGYENWYLPLKILHYKGESTQKSSFKYVHVFYQAMLIFFRKHYGHLSFLITVPIKLAIYGRAFMALLQMLYARVRLSLGFTDTDIDRALYVFIGDGQMHHDCEHIAQSKGLTALYCAAPEEVPTEAIGTQDTFFVYDTSLYTYGQILEMMARRPIPNVRLGTYYPQTHTIITPYEIIK